MKKLKKKLQYWFDNQMSKGAGAMILMLAVITILVVVIVACMINGIEPNEEGASRTFWDVMTTVINAWMPYSEEGGLGFLIPTAIAAIFGLLFTSVLIGIVSTAIEEKIDSLKKGNSIVVEQGHTVVLGFESGAYEVLTQLIEGAAGAPLCLVVAGDGEKDEMESEIRENVEIPKNVKLIYRNVDICSTTALECCSIETASTVIISSYEDMKTVKSVLAVINLLREHPEADVRIVASVKKDEFIFPESLTRKKNVTMIQTNDVIARIIAHSCSQPGISKTFYEVLNFEGAEIYVSGNAAINGRTFGDLYQTMDGGVPIGILRGEHAILSRELNEEVKDGDKLVYMAREKNGYTLRDTEIVPIWENEKRNLDILSARTILIVGGNDQVETILTELPESVKQVVFAETGKKRKKELKEFAKERCGKKVSFVDENLLQADVLDELMEDMDHVILLSNEEAGREESDVHNILLFLKLVDQQVRLGRDFNITAELFFENNRELIRNRNNTDFVVANNMSAMLVSQLAVTPRLNYVYNELLSNEGVEIRLIAPDIDDMEAKTILELRQKTIADGLVLLGYVKKVDGDLETVLNPALDDEVELDEDSMLIVIG